jgi:hypothetical protein
MYQIYNAEKSKIVKHKTAKLQSDDAASNHMYKCITEHKCMQHVTVLVPDA